MPPAVTDRHAENDVGGRIDMTKEWRLTIPDPVASSSRYRAAIGETGEPGAQRAAAPAAKDASVTSAAPAEIPAPAAGHEVAIK